jgi:hypothetical protein
MSFGFAGTPRLFPAKYLEEIPHSSFFECRVAERQVRVDVVAIPPSFTVFGNVAFLQQVSNYFAGRPLGNTNEVCQLAGSYPGVESNIAKHNSMIG